ncbi:hypothetical protein PQX77_022321 [Marasmius sp. AFHP31]|nr:hypothetical protein PQX77_022321 [Marasmius sp. AFHP31]
MGSQFFHRARNTTFGHNNVFQHVEGNVYQNCFSHTSSRNQEEDRHMPRQNEFREFFKGDIYLQEQTWSEEAELVIRIPSRDNRPHRRDMQNRVKVMKKFHTATIFQHDNQKFTVVTFEPKHNRPRNNETIRLLWKAGYEAYSTYKLPWLIQMLGLMKSEIPTFILHGELVNGSKLFSQYNGNSVVWRYLRYTHDSAIATLRADGTLPTEISIGERHWTLDLRSRTWQYDTSTSQYDASTSLRFTGLRHNTITSLQLRGTNPELDAKEIIACFEQTFGECLYLHALTGGVWPAPPHHLKESPFTFGTVVNYLTGQTYAHLSPPPSPEWSLEDYSQGMKVSYSMEGSSRVDWSLHEAHYTRLFLTFSLRVPLHERIRLRVAYLCQSYLIPDSNMPGRSPEIALIDCVEISLFGDFWRDPTTGPTPAYLFVPRLWVDIIDGMFCTYLPLSRTAFYWASDPNGINKIPWKDWGRYGIPDLTAHEHIGVVWDHPDYVFVRDQLRRKGYGEDGARYARDHGYPELILTTIAKPSGDPHNVGQIQELSESPDEDWDEVYNSPVQPLGEFFPPLTSSFEMPLDSQASDILPSQTGWSTEGVFNTQGIEHSSGPRPAKRARSGSPEPPTCRSQ